MKSKWIKMLLSLMLAAVLTVSLSAPVFAAGSEVRYGGKDSGFTFSPESKDLFEAFKGIMPGDSLTQRVKVTNNCNNNTTFFVRMKVAKQEDYTAEELALVHDLLFDSSLLKLTITSGDTVLYSDMAGGDMVRSFEETGEYTSAAVRVGTIASKGGTADIDVKLDVNQDIGNEYMYLIANVDWEFTAEETELPPDTGDSNVFLYAAVVLMSAAMLFAAVYLKKRA